MSESTVPPGAVVTIFDVDVWKKMDDLGIPDEIFDEVCWVLKFIPPSDRVRYLEMVFEPDGF